jgi:hypothetical protein
VFEGLDPSPAGAARWAAAPNLPEDPAPEQGRLTATVNGWPPFPSCLPAFEWLIAALRARE